MGDGRGGKRKITERNVKLVGMIRQSVGFKTPLLRTFMPKKSRLYITVGQKYIKIFFLGIKV
jgi:hypothetical protein